MATRVIRAEALNKTYGSGNTEVVALRDVSIAVERGEVAALLGPSGSGKSTLLTALGLLELPQRGDIWLSDRLVVSGGVAREDLATIRRTMIGFVFQKANLVPFLTAAENVRLALQLNDVTGPPALARTKELLGYLGLGSSGPLSRATLRRATAASRDRARAREPSPACARRRADRGARQPPRKRRDGALQTHRP